MNGKERRDSVSEATTHRLSLLRRCLNVVESEGIGTVSSQYVADRFGLNSAQIRKDLAQFGEFGVRGVGYRIPELKRRLKHLMGLESPRIVVILGAGNLGQALADSRNFNNDDFRVAALFDNDGRKIGGRSRTGIPIRDAAELPRAVGELGAKIGVLAVPAEAAAAGASAFAAAGVKTLLNFAPVSLPPSRGTVVKNVDLTLFLENLSFHLAGRER